MPHRTPGDFPDFGVETLLETLPRLLRCLGVSGIRDPVQPGWEPGQPSTTAVFLNTLYELDPTARPFYDTPVTVGFAKASNALNRTLLQRRGPATKKPTLVLTTKGDTVLSSKDILRLMEKVSDPAAKTVKVFTKQQHDVFVSIDEEDNTESLAVLTNWVKSLGFAV